MEIDIKRLLSIDLANANLVPSQSDKVFEQKSNITVN